MLQWRIHGRGEGAIDPPRLGPKIFFIARPKNTHLQTRFCMPECAKTHSNLEFQNFPREERGGEEREGKGREGGRGRIGKGG